ncbi:MAG: Asp-tRNA(Asn)/Glu-tRNA(Gln) amidotransferase subunit GatC [Oceanococcaceae bacterium]
MSLAEEDLARLARLARLRFDPDSAAQTRDELNTILDMVDRLKSANTQGVQPMAHPLDMVQRLRTDAVSEENAREALMAAAPDARDGLFVVPRVIE